VSISRIVARVTVAIVRAIVGVRIVAVVVVSVVRRVGSVLVVVVVVMTPRVGTIDEADAETRGQHTREHYRPPVHVSPPSSRSNPRRGPNSRRARNRGGGGKSRARPKKRVGGCYGASWR